MRWKRKGRAEEAAHEQPIEQLAAPVATGEDGDPSAPDSAAAEAQRIAVAQAATPPAAATAPTPTPAPALATEPARTDVTPRLGRRGRRRREHSANAVGDAETLGVAAQDPQQDVAENGPGEPGPERSDPGSDAGGGQERSSDVAEARAAEPDQPRRRGFRRRLRATAAEPVAEPGHDSSSQIEAATTAVDPLDEPWLPDGHDDTAAVECTELVKRFGEGETSVLALRGISLEFEPRTFSAIMGPSGSGKSTLMHLLAGLDAPTSGTVRIGGVSLDGLNDRRRTALRRARVGFVFQAFNLLPVLSAQENIELPLRVAGARPDPYWVEELLRAFELTDRRTHRPAELSGGQQQRVAIARALVTQPNVVFADEPTGNIDSAAGEEVLEILQSCVRDYGQTVVMVTHDPLAAAHAARVVFLADGRIVRDERAPSTRRILDALRERG